jgi:hypothetical protein
MPDKVTPKVYQLKLHLLGVSPMVWRRLLVKDDTSIARLHGILQLLMGWENLHLHCFVIYGKHYGIGYIVVAWDLLTILIKGNIACTAEKVKHRKY